MTLNALANQGNYPYIRRAMTKIIPETCTCSALRQASRHLTRLYDDALASVGLGINQFSILSKLESFGPQTLQGLAERLVMDRSTLARLLRPLEQRDLVSIGIAQQDRRHRHIALTPTGAALMREARPLWIDAEKRFQIVFGADPAFDLRVALKRATYVAFDAAPL
jgi:DNA-binding MarR family transcriptional regulator